MTQQIIDFGSFPNDPLADPIRAAFQKVQNNFTELYNATLSTGVTEVLAGTGLSQTRSTGNISLSANISNIRLYTGSSNSLVFGTTTTPTSGNIVTTSSVTPIYIDLAPNIKTTNANFTGKLTTANFAMTGYVTTSFIPSITETYDLGSPTYKWRDLYLSGNSLSLGTVKVTEVGGALAIPNVTVSGNLAAGNVTAGTVSGNLTTAIQPNITSVGTLAQLEVAGSISAGTITGNVVLPPGANIQAPGSNMQILFNDSGNQSAVPGLMFDKANTLLTIQGNIAGDNLTIGNAQITGNIGVNKVVATGNIQGSNLVTLGVVATQSGITTGASLDITSITGDGGFVTINFATQETVPFASGSVVTITGVSPSSYNGSWTVATGLVNRITIASSLTSSATVTSAKIKGNGNATINGVLEVIGNTTLGNITAVNRITGNTITLSGNVDSGNLLASGIIQVTGTANLGAVYSPGDANVQNALIRGSFGATGAATFAGTITANADASFYANVLANANMSVTGAFTAGTANIANFIITSGGNATANIFTATLFSGNGANISFINGANVTGVVPQASTALSVNGANVTGTVASATYAASAASATSATTATSATSAATASYATTAGSVTNGVYTNGAYSNPSWVTSLAYSKLTGAPTIPGTSSSVQYYSIGVGRAATGTSGELYAAGQIYSDNNITAYNSSDRKWKNNIRPIPNALAKVRKIGGKLFDWTDEYLSQYGKDEYFTPKSDFGVIAQDLIDADFEIATRVKKDGSLGVDYMKLSALAFQAVLELDEELAETRQTMREIQAEILKLKTDNGAQ